MVFDHCHNRVYAALSERCNEQLLKRFTKRTGIKEVISFSTQSSHGKAIYHTNVMMSIGDGFAVVCSDCISDVTERKQVMESLSTHHEVIEISIEQMEEYFCGNILNIRNRDGDALIIMSDSAYQGFTFTQQEILKKHGKLIINSIPTIEKIGGGSCRCMLAEIFLPSQETTL